MQILLHEIENICSWTTLILGETSLSLKMKQFALNVRNVFVTYMFKYIIFTGKSQRKTYLYKQNPEVLFIF